MFPLRHIHWFASSSLSVKLMIPSYRDNYPYHLYHDHLVGKHKDVGVVNVGTTNITRDPTCLTLDEETRYKYYNILYFSCLALPVHLYPFLSIVPIYWATHQVSEHTNTGFACWHTTWYFLISGLASPRMVICPLTGYISTLTSLVLHLFYSVKWPLIVCHYLKVINVIFFSLYFLNSIDLH